MKTHLFVILRIISISTIFASLIACTSLPDNSQRKASYSLNDTEQSTMAKAYQMHSKEAQADGKDGILLLPDGLDAFVARIALIKAADKSIDLQYYLYHDDMVGKLLLEQLLLAAQRGIRIRMLIDDMGLQGKDKALLEINKHPNIEMRVFNPFSRNSNRFLQMVSGFGKLTRRMHNKSFTVDNSASIVGGRNIGNEYFDADPELNFSDLDVMVTGPVVKDISHSFDLYWNSNLSYPIDTLNQYITTVNDTDKIKKKLDEFIADNSHSEYLIALKNSDLAKNIANDTIPYHWGQVKVVSDLPEKISSDRNASELHLATQLAPYFTNLQKELIIFSPYFIPGKEGVEFFSTLRKKGVRIRILTNSMTSSDVGIVHAGYKKYRKPLLKMGIELYELDRLFPTEKKKNTASGSSKASLHTKSFVFDRQKVFIGSLNLDPRSVIENSEIGVVLESKEIAIGMSDIFDQDIDKVAFKLELVADDHEGEKIRWSKKGKENKEVFYHDPHTTLWQRFIISLLSILPIESQL